MSFGYIGCEKEASIHDELLTQDLEIAAQVELPAPIEHENFKYELPNEKWGYTPHYMTMYIAAKKCGLSDSRAAQMASSANLPDTYDGSHAIPGTQQWRHGYVYLVSGVYSGFGIAPSMCANNINGNGYSGRSAFYYYLTGNKSSGDWYLGYASHYLQDLGNPWHTASNLYQQLTHNSYETWVANNWSAGHKFQDAVNADNSYYTVSNPATSAVNLARYSNGRNSTISKAYNDSNKPTAAGTGNSTLVSETRTLLIYTARYNKGLIRYTLNACDAW